MAWNKSKTPQRANRDPNTGSRDLGPELSNTINQCLLAAQKAYQEDDFSGAAENYQRVLHLQPQNIEALKGLGGIGAQLGQLWEAEGLLKKAYHIGGRDNALDCTLGSVLRRAGKLSEARNYLERAVADHPKSPENQLELGLLLSSLQNYAGAATHLKESLSLAPMSKAPLDELLFCQTQTCDWQGAAQTRILLAELTRQELAADGEVSLSLRNCLTPGIDAELVKAVVQRAMTQAVASRPLSTKTASADRQKNDKIKIGYLSQHFSSAEKSALAATLLQKHDRSRFEVHAFTGQALSPELCHWSDKVHAHEGRNARYLADAIRQQDIDILVDLDGLESPIHSQILGFRCAPVQTQLWGPSIGSGPALSDYQLTHAGQHVAQLSEHQAVLPGLPNSLPQSQNLSTGIDKTRADFGLNPRSFVFACFEDAEQLDAEAVASWIKVLSRCPRSQLWLKPQESIVTASLRDAAAAAEVSPLRIVFTAPEQPELAEMALADLWLDTFGDSSLSLVSTALEAGVPVVSRIGALPFQSRAAQLVAVSGLEQLVCADTESYEEVAIQLALDSFYYHQKEQGLAGSISQNPILDSSKYVQSLEKAYLTMWQRFQDGLPPQSFELAENSNEVCWKEDRNLEPGQRMGLDTRGAHL